LGDAAATTQSEAPEQDTPIEGPTFEGRLWADQVLPPLAVMSTVVRSPFESTAKQVVSEGQEIDAADWPAVAIVLIVVVERPALLSRWMTSDVTVALLAASAAMTKHVRVVGHERPRSESELDQGSSAHEEPPFTERARPPWRAA
jgi:hypothetical protein